MVVRRLTPHTIMNTPEIRILQKRNEVQELREQIKKRDGQIRDVFIEARKRERDMAARILQLEKMVARLEKELGHQK